MLFTGTKLFCGMKKVGYLRKRERTVIVQENPKEMSISWCYTGTFVLAQSRVHLSYPKEVLAVLIL